MTASQADTLARLPLTERQLQDAIVQCAEVLGWQTHHQKYAIQSAKGWPDLTLCRPPRLIAAELKRDGRAPTPSQRHWLDLLAACGVETHVWRPSDWLDGSIERILRRQQGKEVP